MFLKKKKKKNKNKQGVTFNPRLDAIFVYSRE